MGESPYYLNRQGYLCFKNSDKPLHRYIAKKEVWEKNRKKYPLEFWEYQVHHKDKNKLNNNPENLELLTKLEHETQHGLERREWDIIRILMVIIFMMFASVVWSLIGKKYHLTLAMGIWGMFLIWVIGYLVMVYLTREKKGITKII